jgi:hypothetical protein
MVPLGRVLYMDTKALLKRGQSKVYVVEYFICFFHEHAALGMTSMQTNRNVPSTET